MSPGRHAAEDDDLPSFTGDVPTDLTLTGQVVRRRFYRIFARGPTAFGSAFVLILAVMLVLTGLVLLVPDDDRRSLPVVIALTVLAAGCGTASLVRPVPGPVRFALGAVPAGALLFAATLAGGTYDTGGVALAAALAALVTGGAYVIVAGLRLSAHAQQRLTDVDSARPPQRDSAE